MFHWMICFVINGTGGRTVQAEAMGTLFASGRTERKKKGSYNQSKEKLAKS